VFSEERMMTKNDFTRQGNSGQASNGRDSDSLACVIFSNNDIATLEGLHHIMLGFLEVIT
jgi:hypothetical protein